MTLLSIDWLLMLEKFILIAVIIFTSLGLALYTTFGERKVAAILEFFSGMVPEGRKKEEIRKENGGLPEGGEAPGGG